MPTNHRKRKQITFTLDGQTWECQIMNAEIVNNTEDGEKFYTYCPPGVDGTDNEFREEADDDYALELSFFVDWGPNGISRALLALDQQTVDFEYIDYPDHPDWQSTRTGKVKVKAPNYGGEVRVTDQKEVTYPIIGKPSDPIYATP